jgi:hypothetical protein
MNGAAQAHGDRFGWWPALYCLWAALAIGLSLAQGGWSDANITRLSVLAFIALQFAFRAQLVQALPQLAPRTRFIVLAALLAAVVEGLHMISKPVFDALRITAATTPYEALRLYAIDLAFTLPAYGAIFAVIWWCIRRWHYGLWAYLVTMGLAQALGDGGLLFFAGAPQMLAFLPYPMTNYHACNVIPFLAVRGALPATRPAGAAGLLAIPAVIAVYFVCGALIKVLGRAAGFGGP